MYLRDVLGTKYLVPEYSRDLQYLIDNAVKCILNKEMFTANIWNDGIVKAINDAVPGGKMFMDIADCRISKPVWSVLSQCKRYKDLIFVFDSEDDDRNMFLNKYFQFEYEYKDLPETYLPRKPSSYNDLSEWVNALRTDVVYKVNAQFEYLDCPHFMLAINLLRPDVKMIVSLEGVMQYAKRKFANYLHTECTEFLYKMPDNDECLYTRMDECGMVHVTNIGEFPRDLFITKFACMPAFIGRERFSPVQYPKGTCLYEAVSDIMKDTRAFLAERPITIETYFPFREEYK